MIGKTGSGKTTVTALVAMALAGRGRRVVAVDTDVSPNLGVSLGLPVDVVDAARSVPRAMARGRAGGGITAAEVVDAYALATPPGVALLHAMAASDQPAGCGCPAHASGHGLLASVLDEAFDVAVVDLEAGLDHLDRTEGTLAHADALLVVVEPSRKSVLTGGRMVERAKSFRAGPLLVVGNKVHPDGHDDDAALVAEVANEHGLDVAGLVPFSPAVADADRAGTGLRPTGPLAGAVEAIADRLLAAPAG